MVMWVSKTEGGHLGDCLDYWDYCSYLFNVQNVCRVNFWDYVTGFFQGPLIFGDFLVDAVLQFWFNDISILQNSGEACRATK